MSTLKKSPITILLIVSISLVFFGMQILYPGNAESAYVIYRFGGLIGSVLKENISNFWRLITPIFVHIGWEHFLFNTITLFFLGQLSEKIYGHIKFLILFFLSGIMGNVFVLLLTPEVIVAGASTSIFGLFSAIVVTGYFSKNPTLRNLSNTYRTLIIINLIFNLTTPNVSIVGHLGGLIGGILLGIGLGPQKETSLSLFPKIISLIFYFVVLISLIIFAITH
ncbi:rhomboid family intramembrane serine protease [Streptococcus thoraltensis]|uniref:rhomboid family intramembrane serine protease n=1 Tax=Streptococcus thoraltensis TaxID=55085 RepID=UPI001F562F53|nr:rhomboid family intramembrane serine protease [Streptococcus thoraltensis]